LAFQIGNYSMQRKTLIILRQVDVKVSLGKN